MLGGGWIIGYIGGYVVFFGDMFIVNLIYIKCVFFYYIVGGIEFVCVVWICLSI